MSVHSINLSMELERLVDEITQCLSIIQNKKVSKTWVINELIKCGMDKFQENYLAEEVEEVLEALKEAS